MIIHKTYQPKSETEAVSSSPYVLQKHQAGRTLHLEFLLWIYASVIPVHRK